MVRKKKYKEECSSYIGDEDEVIVPFSDEVIEVGTEAQLVDLSDIEAVRYVLSRLEKTEPLFFDFTNFGEGGVFYQSITLAYYIKVLTEVGNFDKAFALAEVILQNLDSTPWSPIPMAHNHIGNIFFKKKEYASAIMHYDNGLKPFLEQNWEADSEAMNLYLYKALSLIYLGREKEAVEHFQSAEKYDTSHINPMEDFSNSLWIYFFLKKYHENKNDNAATKKYQQLFVTKLKSKTFARVKWELTHFQIPEKYIDEVLDNIEK
ncbi:hypothetical protein [Capnocytophaga felis]|uniref:Tetratricopeptide repeat protein n=1 Tax=Capnocytophaga felis TaxID=2267611 RepID=A0A5M4B693_9FLAO|nr:hypothetical protein [Capnocytophaga felis]GET45109.1 hypothetical protein RCZ01_04110 [Capnocytophaga felis]GET47727.1 hypothetical protein RCZ02_05580 [Capnocytophaga felis]